MKGSVEIELNRFIDDQVASGAYSSPEDVVQAAMAALRQSSQFGEFAPGELNRLLEEGEQSLVREGSIPAEQVFDELRRRSADRRRTQP